MRSRSPSGFTLVEMLIVMAIIGVLAALAIPNYIKYQARAKQAEAKANLKALFVQEQAYFAAKDTYSQYVDDVGFSPERGNRYTYRLAEAGTLQKRSSAALGPTLNCVGVEADTFRWINVGIAADMHNPAGFAGVLPGNNGWFVASAVTNLDADAVFDFWSIGTLYNSGMANTETATPGVPFNVVDDVVYETQG